MIWPWAARPVTLADGLRRRTVCAQLDALQPPMVDGVPHRPRLVWRFPMRDRRKLWLQRSERGTHGRRLSGRFGAA